MSFNWKEAIITRSATIHDAVRAIDKEALKIALVVGEDYHLEGVVTDGDIRRGLLRHVDLDSPVTEVMNENPVVCDPQTSMDQIRKILEEKILLHMPIVEAGRIVDLITWDQVHERKHYDNPVVLMAGGFGTRLRPLTDEVPKPLLKVGEKAVLERIVERFVASGFSTFYISLHYLPEKVVDYFGDGSKWGVNIQYMYEETPLGTAGALSLLPHDQLDDSPVILMNGDLLTNVDFEQLLLFHHEHEAVATMCVREYGFEVPYGVVEAKDHSITKIIEKQTHRFFVNAGIYVLNPNIAASIEPNTVIDMPALLMSQIENDESVAMFPIREYWLDIGQRKDFDQAQLDYSRDSG